MAEQPSWTFLSNYTHVMVCLHRDPDVTLREIADRVGITVRGVQRIVADLAREGYLTIDHRGRHNHYTVDRTRRLRHDLERDVTVGQLLDLVGGCAVAGA